MNRVQFKDIFNNKLTQFKTVHLYLKKYLLVSSVVHLSIEDGLQCMSIRQLPHKGGGYHQRLLTEERRFFSTLPTEN